MQKAAEKIKRSPAEGAADSPTGEIIRQSSRRRFAEVTSEERVVYSDIIKLLRTASNMRRLEILELCIEPQTFSQIIFNLRLNPASFKFHIETLETDGLIMKKDKRYRTTPLGKALLDFANTFYDTIHETR